ncbi:hypothetical protein BCR33DRAFT_36827 [Rhizoclosmatium globosum]|uniref:Uncharacterized protein n=1 Tax=Rhizoclosmatium globosum TaxID=329046 RepID=A0A1Y2CN95_9FUNG|nr:hypothetical protein BCR33DRAFT_36827 [Rhizoclosmatium globosum]|eukprot:ORY48501.1 hypothetical protein BCR33DRAFT_36827 [Rhizoclosmatium globosum]
MDSHFNILPPPSHLFKYSIRNLLTIISYTVIGHAITKKSSSRGKVGVTRRPCAKSWNTKQIRPETIADMTQPYKSKTPYKSGLPFLLLVLMGGVSWVCILKEHEKENRCQGPCAQLAHEQDTCICWWRGKA